MDNLKVHIGLIEPRKYVSLADAEGNLKIVDYDDSMDAFNKLSE